MTHEEVMYHQASSKEAELQKALEKYPAIICEFFAKSFLNSDRQDDRFDAIYSKVLNGEITTVEQIIKEWK